MLLCVTFKVRSVLRASTFAYTLPTIAFQVRSIFLMHKPYVEKEDRSNIPMSVCKAVKFLRTCIVLVEVAKPSCTIPIETIPHREGSSTTTNHYLSLATSLHHRTFPTESCLHRPHNTTKMGKCQGPAIPGFDETSISDAPLEEPDT